MLQYNMKNPTALILYLQDTLHVNVSLSNEKLDYKKPIPIAIKSNYNIFTMKIETIDVIVLDTDEDDIKALKKHIKLFQEALSKPIVLSIYHLSKSTKKYLIENAISFISNQSVYLPRLLIHLDDTIFKKNKPTLKKLSKLAQTILISLIVNKELKVEINNSAEKFAVTKMSASRALNELVDFNFLNVQVSGRKNSYFLNGDIDIEILFSKLKNPVLDVVYIKKDDLFHFDIKHEASFSALSVYSNITNHKSIFAIEKSYFNRIIEKDAFKVYEKEYDTDLIELELWRYAPQSIQNDIVDKISLYLSLQDKLDLEDSRLMNANRELYNEIKGMLN